MNLEGSAGYITSPGYPGEYDNDLNCSYVMRLDSGGPWTVQLSVEFNLADREDEGDCPADYLQVHEAHGHGHRYCGAGQATRRITVTGNEWFASFHTDGSITRERGFILYYTVL